MFSYTFDLLVSRPRNTSRSRCRDNIRLEFAAYIRPGRDTHSEMRLEGCNGNDPIVRTFVHLGEYLQEVTFDTSGKRDISSRPLFVLDMSISLNSILSVFSWFPRALTWCNTIEQEPKPCASCHQGRTSETRART